MLMRTRYGATAPSPVSEYKVASRRTEQNIPTCWNQMNPVVVDSMVAKCGSARPQGR